MTDQLAFSSTDPGHRRLTCCTAASAVILLGALTLIEWPADYRESGDPAEIELSLLRDEPQPVPEPPVDEPAEQPAEEPAEEPSVVDEEVEVPVPPPSTTPEQPDEPAAAPAPTQQPEIDWQASLERASAKTVDEHAEVDSLHPEFDELRRIAARKYAEPRTGKPPPIWENVETDIYGRKLLRMGDCFRVLDDPNVGNRYAFETFEQHLVFCDLRRNARQKFPWIKSIVERYPYLREPDGGAAGPAGKQAERGFPTP